MADLFDGAPSETAYFRLEDYASSLYKQANPSLTHLPDFTITERTLGNSMDFDEWKLNKYNWKSVDDDQEDQNSPIWPEDYGTV